MSSAPALAAKANGINIFDGLVAAFLATTTVTGSNAAAAPLGVMKALSTAASTITAANNRARFVPARSVSICPAQAVTPDASSPSLTTNRVAMKMTTGSPNPLNAVAASSTPVK